MPPEYDDVEIFVEQEDETWCAPAVIQMILKKAEIEVSQAKIAAFNYKGRLLADENGANFEVVKKFMKTYFSKVRVYNKTDYAKLIRSRAKDLEVITCIESHEEDGNGGLVFESHYVRIGGVDSHGIDLFDPSYGFRPDGNNHLYTLSKKDFKTVWEKWALVIDLKSRIV